MKHKEILLWLLVITSFVLSVLALMGPNLQSRQSQAQIIGLTIGSGDKVRGGRCTVHPGWGGGSGYWDYSSGNWICRQITREVQPSQ